MGNNIKVPVFLFLFFFCTMLLRSVRGLALREEEISGGLVLPLVDACENAAWAIKGKKREGKGSLRGCKDQNSHLWFYK